MTDDLATSYYRHRHRPSELYGRERGGWRAPAPRKPPHAHYTAHRQPLVTLYYDHFFQNRDNSPCKYSDRNIPINNNKIKAKRKQKKQRIHENTQGSWNSAKDSTDISTDEYLKIMAKKCSMPEVTSSVETPKRQEKKWRRSETYINSSTPYQTKYVVNAVLLDPKCTPPQCHPLLQHPLMQAQLRIYRCQLSTKQESCCCSCNSDAMFEVMKSLYDCYKKKDCNNCKCVLCGHLPREERKRGEARKSRVSVGVETASTRKKAKETMKTTPSMGPLEPLAGLTSAEKEKALKDLAKKGVPLPEGRTYSEKKLVEKVTKDLGISTPEHLRKATAAGLLTPIDGKSDEQKEKIIRGLALGGLPLPEGKTASERKVIDKVRKDLGLPPEPKSSLEKEKYVKAQAAGFITPLEGKSKSQKERVLTGLAERGIPLPEGRTSSEKALIQKIKAEVKPLPSKPTTPSAKSRKAKESGLMTPLEGKTSEQKEKIIRDRVMSGLPLPEAKTASEKKIIEKTRKDLGLPPEPKTASEKKLLKDAQTAGIISPLEGKTRAQKEKILSTMAEMGVPLPEGRTPSEKALIQKIQTELKPIPALPSKERIKLDKKTAKVMKEGKGPSDECICGLLTPVSERLRSISPTKPGLMTPLEGKTASEKEKILRGRAAAGLPMPEGKTASETALIKKVKTEAGYVPPVGRTLSTKERQAKAAGFLTPLEGKTSDQKEAILRGRAKAGLPLPEGKTASEKKMIKKIRSELGLPPEPTTRSLREKMEKAQAAGIITPLEGKTSAEKQQILKKMAAAGIPLPEGRTSSEKALIRKIAAEAPSRQAGLPSTKMREARVAGLLTPLEGKTTAQKQKIIEGLAKSGIPLPEAKTASEKKLIEKVRTDLGLPPEPTTKSLKARMSKAYGEGIITPLEGKTSAEKEKILKRMATAGIPLPEGRTASEKALTKKIVTEAPSRRAGIQSAKLREARSAGLMTPLTGKTPQQQEKILKGLAQRGILLPEGKTESERKIISKVRADLGLPPEPTTKSMREKMSKAVAAGIVTPLEGKTNAQKEKILKNMAAAGIPLPEGRTASEKGLIKKIAAEVPSAQVKTPSGKLREAKAAGLLTPLEGKTQEQKEKILKALAKSGVPLPEPKTASEKRIIEKVRSDLGLPPEPTTRSMKKRMSKAIAAGVVTALEGKTSAQKEKILKSMAAAGIPLPEGRTASEKSMIKKIKTESKAAKEISRVQIGPPSLPPEKRKKLDKKTAKNIKEGTGPVDECICPLLTPESDRKESEAAKIERSARQAGVSSAKIREAKAAGLMTPLEGKTTSQKEQILRDLAKTGIPLPEAKTASEKKIAEKVRTQLGLPPEPTTKSVRDRISKAQAAEIVTPLEGKTSAQKEKILRSMAAAGVPLPEGRTASEKALIKKVAAEVPAKIPSEKMRAAKEAGLLTPLDGKSQEEKEKIIKRLVKSGIPLPQPRTSSEREVIAKVRTELGLPPEPKTLSIRDKMSKAQAAGIITPLEGKSPSQKEQILKRMAEAGVPLPEGRTPSERAIIKKIAVEAPARHAGVPSVKLREARAAGLMTPIEGKTSEQKEKIIRGLAKSGMPLPVPKTPSEKKIMEKVRTELGLPPEPTSKSIRERMTKAQAAGIITPLEGKTSAQKEKILKSMATAGIPLPEGRTPSEKALIKKIESEVPSARVKTPSQKMREAKAAGLTTPLEGKTQEQKEKILKALAKSGVPLPEPKTASEKRMIDKVRTDLGLPPEPKTRSMKERMSKAIASGVVTALEGKTPAQKEKILKSMAAAGIPLPEGRTASEKSMIKKIKTESKAAKETSRVQLGPPPLPPEKRKKLDEKTAKKVKEGTGPVDECICSLLTPESDRASKPTSRKEIPGEEITVPLEGKTHAEKEKILKKMAADGVALPEGRTSSEKALIKQIEAEAPSRAAGIPSAKLRDAKAAGLITPLEGKTTAQKEKILKGLVEKGLPLPEGKTPSEKKLIQKVRADLGLPPAPTTKSIRERMSKAHGAGIITPLEGKTASEKARILKRMASAGVPLPEGRTSSEKALIRKIEAETPSRQAGIPSAKLREAKIAGLMTPLDGKTPAQQEKILKGLVEKGLPLPEGKTPSQKRIIQKVRADLGLPPASTTKSIRERMSKAHGAGIITPLEGKSAAEKEKILKKMASAGVPLPEGRTSSEKALIKKIEVEAPARRAGVPSVKLQEARAAGFLTPLEGKTSEQKEKILKGLAKSGVPMPEAKTPSEKRLIEKVRTELGLPSEPERRSMKEKLSRAQAAGIVTPLEGKTKSQKEKILKGMAAAGVPLPEGRTASEKALIRAITAEAPSRRVGIPSTKIREARAAGLLTPLAGKSQSEQEKVLKGLAKAGIPLPEGKTASERRVIQKVRADLGLPPEPTTKSIRERMSKAHAAGIITPLEGKTPEQKEQILRKLASAGIPLPEGKTSSEKALLRRVAAEAPPFISPLEGKTDAEKKKILRKMTEAGIPLPEGQSPSEKEMIRKAKKESRAAGEFEMERVGPPALPPEARRKLDEKTAKVIKEGKGPSDECICPLLTPETERVSKPPSRRLSRAAKISEKIQKVQERGLLTPLEGKTKSEKERIIKGMADAGLPLPEATTTSEKSIVKKITAERLQKAKERGLLTPLAGKSKAEQERIIKGLAEAGLPLPEGKTASEKSLIKKMKTDYEITPSIRKKIKTAKSGPAASRKVAKGMVARSTAGIQEEIEEIVKTTTCERGCGCDKKKIRFKHSYVKIRVTSPDISSFCACPDECIPGVKGGVFTDNEGIKVTIGTATGVPSLSRQTRNPDTMISYKNKFFRQSKHESVSCKESLISLEIASLSSDSLLECEGSDSTVYIYNSETDVSVSDLKRLLHRSIYEHNLAQRFEASVPKENPLSYIFQSRYNEPARPVNKLPRPPQVTSSHSYDQVSDSSSGSFYVVETESSDSDQSTGTVDVLSLLARNLEPSMDNFHGRQLKHAETKHKLRESFKDASLRTNLVPVFTFHRKRKRHSRKGQDCRGSESSDWCGEMARWQPPARRCASCVSLATASSICVVMSTSGHESCSDGCESTLCFEMSGMLPKRNELLIPKKGPPSNGKLGLRFSTKGGKVVMEGPLIEDIWDQGGNKKGLGTTADMCQTSQIKFRIQLSGHAVSMDTTEDRPCCCAPAPAPRGSAAPTPDECSQNSYSSRASPPDQRCVDSVISHFMNPFLTHAPGLQDSYMNVGFNQTPSSFHTTVTCQRGDSKVMWDLPQEPGSPHMPCTPETCHTPPTEPQLSPPAGGGYTLPQLSPPAWGGFPLPQQGNHQPMTWNHEPCPALDPRYAGYGQRPIPHRSPPINWCKESPCSVGCHPYVPPPPPARPDVGAGVGPEYSGVDVSPETMRARPQDKDSQSVGVEATCSMISNLLDQKLKPNSSKEPPFIYEGKILKDIMDRCTSTEELIRNKKALQRQAAADNMAREMVVDRNVETEGKTCRCEKASGPGRWKLRKNHICECPPEPAPPPPPEPVFVPPDFDWSSLDDIQKAFDKEQRKMKSDLTQTMSGFKVLRKRKPPADEMMSFEDMLAYYDAHPEEAPPPDPKPDGNKPILPYDNCACHESPGKKNQVECDCLAGLPRNGRNECGCPPEPEESVKGSGASAEGAPEPPFPGLKFHIGGKGSATPGLTGICCFDFTEGSYSSSQDLKSDSESSSY